MLCWIPQPPGATLKLPLRVDWQVRRLCRGVCFTDPALTAEDAQWRESDDEAAAAWSAPAPDLLQPAAGAANGEAAHSCSGCTQPIWRRFAKPKGDRTALGFRSAADATSAVSTRFDHDAGQAMLQEQVKTTCSNDPTIHHIDGPVGVCTGQKAMRFSTAADPSAVVASAAAAERKQRKEHESKVAAAAAAAAADTAGSAVAGEGPPEKASQTPAPVPEALAALPPTLGRFMASQGFAAPTAIQAK